MQEDSLKQIGQRLKGLREVLGIPPEEIADVCQVPLERYYKMEEGEVDLSLSSFENLQTIWHQPRRAALR